MKCYNCNCELEENFLFCPECGANLEKNPISEPAPVYVKEKKGKKPLVIVIIVLVCLWAGGIIAVALLGGFDAIFGSDDGSGGDKDSGEVIDGSKGEGGSDKGILSFFSGEDTHVPPSVAKPDKDKTEHDHSDDISNDTDPSLEETEPSNEETEPVTDESDKTEPEPGVSENVWEGSSRVVIANGGLNMRSAPDISASVINLIPNGNMITVERVENNWAYVSYGGSVGWCSCDYLFVPLEYTAEPLYTATVRCNDKIEMLSEGYAEDGEVRTDLYNGTAVYVYVIDGGRAFVKYNNIYGWCPAEYLELN